jgi:hypothetical protein
MGKNSTASGFSSTAIGDRARATNDYTTAIGLFSNASGSRSTAIGTNSLATGYESIAIGSGEASGQSSVATTGGDASGDYSVSIGLASASSGNYATTLGYWNSANGNYSTAMGHRITVDGNSSFGIGLDGSSYTVAQSNVMAIMGGNVSIGSVSPNGYDFYVGGEAYCSGSAGCWHTSSDITLKKDITGLEYGLDEVMLLQPKRYVWKESGESDIGLLAQDVKGIVPEVVSGEEGHMGIGYSALVPVLINGMQELKGENDALKDEIAELKAITCLDHPEAEICN